MAFLGGRGRGRKRRWRREREEKRRGWTNLLTLELIEQNESCTETKRDRKAKGREENLMGWGGEEGGTGERGRVCRGETDTRGGGGR